jgi:hypothetical protein
LGESRKPDAIGPDPIHLAWHLSEASHPRYAQLRNITKKYLSYLDLKVVPSTKPRIIDTASHYSLPLRTWDFNLFGGILYTYLKAVPIVVECSRPCNLPCFGLRETSLTISSRSNTPKSQAHDCLLPQRPDSMAPTDANLPAQLNLPMEATTQAQRHSSWSQTDNVSYIEFFPEGEWVNCPQAQSDSNAASKDRVENKGAGDRNLEHSPSFAIRASASKHAEDSGYESRASDMQSLFFAQKKPFKGHETGFRERIPTGYDPASRIQLSKIKEYVYLGDFRTSSALENTSIDHGYDGDVSNNSSFNNKPFFHQHYDSPTLIVEDQDTEHYIACMNYSTEDRSMLCTEINDGLHLSTGDPDITEPIQEAVLPRFSSEMMSCEDRGEVESGKDDTSESDYSETDDSFSSTSESVHSSWPDTPNTAEREGLMPPILGLTRRLIVDRLMEEVHTLLDQHVVLSSRAGSSEVSRSEAQSPERIDIGSRNVKKRPIQRREGSETPGDDPDENRYPKRAKTVPQVSTDPPRRLACPFYQRNPSRHQKYRSCAGPGWPTVHRLK